VNIFELIWFVFFAACVAAAATIGAAWLGWPGGVLGAGLGVLLVWATLFYMNRSTMEDACWRVRVVPCVLPEPGGLQQVLAGDGLTVSEPKTTESVRDSARRLLGIEAYRLWRHCLEWSSATESIVVGGPNGESVFVCASEPESALRGVQVLVLLGSEHVFLDQIEKKLRVLATPQRTRDSSQAVRPDGENRK
jgi:hypothetical protein